MCRFFLFSCFLLFFPGLLFSQERKEDGILKTEYVKLERDTVWIINTEYSLYYQKLKLTLDFSELTDKPVKVNWGIPEEGDENISAANQITHTYDRGLYDLRLTNSAGKVYHYMVFNKDLTADFDMFPDPFRFCLGAKGDSLLIVKKGAGQNLPGTEYRIVVEGPQREGEQGLYKVSDWFGPKSDSAWVVFHQATGVTPCQVYMELSYSDTEGKIKMEEETNPKKISVYGAPDVKEIFGFQEVESGSAIENMKVCTGKGQDYLNLKPEILAYYQHKKGSSTPIPYYNSYSDSKNLEIHYYYTDTLYDGMPESSWREVTGKKDTVSVTEKVDFFVPGYYKMMITANNICNEVGDVKIDTLWTEKVKGTTDERYFQVYSYDESKILCKNNTLCLNKSDSIVIVDYNSRRGFEEPPVYNLHAADKDGVEQAVTTTMKIWRGGKVLNMPEAKNAGCDSTVICIRLNNSDFYGELNLTLTRETFCGNMEYTVKVHVGRTPWVDREELYQDLVKNYACLFDGTVYRHCDPFRYAFPVSYLSEADNTRGFPLDSVYFYVRQGTGREDAVLYRQGESDALTYWLDSTDVKSGIRIRSYNVCGWTEDSIQLQVNTRPRVSLWRDGVEQNDTLCVGVDYPYYWKGKWPKGCEMYLTPSDTIFVNGQVNVAGNQVLIKNGDIIRHVRPGLQEEGIYISNADMPSCALDSAWEVEIVAFPDTLIHPDSVGYCEGSLELQTAKLFRPGKTGFKWAEWSLNTKDVSKEHLPEFNLTGQVDTLRYKLSQSKGCYVKGQLLLRPQTVPELKLKDETGYCLPAVVSFRDPGDFVEKLSDWKGYNRLTVYENERKASHQRYQDSPSGSSPYPLNESMQGAKWIYELENIRVDTALMGKCRVLDTVTLHISAPKVKVLKSDTLKYPWSIYRFARLEEGAFLDTAQIVPASIKWTLRPEGTALTGITGLYGGAYSLTAEDKGKDTLLFELSAESYCGQLLKDTLVVALNRLKAQGYKDTICSNTADYPLWDKMKWAHVDLASVQWKIVYPSVTPGTLSTTTGSGATYTPEEETGDSVRIWFEAALEEVPSEKRADTVVLRINRAPVLKFLKDTLWACNREVRLNDIHPDYIDTANIGGGLKRNDWVTDPGASGGFGQVGGWSGDNYTFEKELLSGHVENITQKVSYKAIGLPGCGVAIDTVVLADPVPFKLTFKRGNEDMCAGDRIKLDTLYNTTGNDPFARTEWTLASNKWGHFEDGHYVASQPEDKTQELIVTTYKEYTCYNGKASGKVLKTDTVRLPLTVHREPEFSVVHPYDTLCRETREIRISRDWVKVAEGYYPDYRDSVRVNGMRLLDDGLGYTLAAKGQREKLVVSIAQGHCAKWNSRSDTIFLFRLPDMLTGSFVIDNVCEGGQAEIDKTALEISPLATGVAWSASGGSISADHKYFIPDADVRTGSVRLTADAPHGCGTESLPEVPVNIGRKPQLQNRAYTMCRLEGQTLSVSAAVKDPTVQVQKIDWYRCGKPDQLITTTGADKEEWSFVASAADVELPEMCLVAKIQSIGACRGIFEDTVRIGWQEKPAFTVGNLSICQADATGIDLETEVQTGNAGSVEWELQTGAAGTLDGSVFYPGEAFSGPVTVNLKMTGLWGCPDVIEPLTVTVKPAPESAIVLSGENCTGREVTLKPGSNRARSYSWDFGDGLPVEQVTRTSHVYQSEGTYTVSMTAYFDNQCTRTEKKTWSVNPTPQARFALPDPVPIAKPVSLASTSVPETVTCNWTVDATTTYSEPSIAHVFKTAGSHEVQLVVVSPEGCTDTMARSTTVLGKPVAAFELEVDSCSGTVKVKNQSVRNGATVAWDFGNGQSVTDVWQPEEQTYPLVWQDTLYTIRLSLANVSDTVECEKTFRMVSLLKPAFELWSDNDPCNKTDKEIRVLTKGKADTTWVDWGDGTQPDKWLAKEQVNVLTHVYPENMTTAAREYTVSLQAMNACYRPDPLRKSVAVIPLQIRARIQEEEEREEYKNKCYGHERAFWNKSFGFVPQGYTCEWDFGDRTSPETDTVSVAPKAHLFETPGTYTIRLRVKDECQERLDSVKIVVHGNDSLDFAFEKDKNQLCTGESVRLWLVQRGKEPFTDLRWTLPDGTRQEGDTIQYKFTEPGKWLVSLKATADGCAENPLGKYGRVHQTPLPLIDAANTAECVPVTVPFRAVNGKGDTENMKIAWDFGDGTSSQEIFPPEKVYEKSGQYVVKLNMVSPEGCVAEDSLLVNAKITPDVRMELDRHLVCSPDGNFEITAFNRSLAPEDCSYEWYRNQEVLSMVPDSVVIPFVGFYGKEEIALRAVHKVSGCESRMTDTVIASQPVKAGLWVAPDTVCEGAEVVFRDTVPAAETLRQLIFEDGTWEEAPEVVRTYWEAGKYAYLYTVSNPDGCTDTIRDTVYVHSLPVAEFDWRKDRSVTGIEGMTTSDVENGGVRFTNTSVIRPLDWETAGLHYYWDFGDGTDATGQDPVHRFANNGSYEVWLYAVSDMGCRDSVSRVIDMTAIKGLFFPNAMAPASSDPGVNRFQPKGIGLHLFSVKVYAPDGTCVWQTDKLDEGRPAEFWDGTYNGQVVPAGVYTWEASAVFIDGTVQNHINGSLIVIR